MRAQISLKPELQKRARHRATELGISMAEYVRRLITRDLGELTETADPSAIFNLGNSGGSNIARDKDRLIGEAFSSDLERRQQ